VIHIACCYSEVSSLRERHQARLVGACLQCWWIWVYEFDRSSTRLTLDLFERPRHQIPSPSDIGILVEQLGVKRTVLPPQSTHGTL